MFIFLGQGLLRIAANNLTRKCFSSAAVDPLEKRELQNIELPSKISRINPLSHPDYFGVEKMFTVRDLMEARVHFGHKDGSLNDRMKEYLFGSRLGHTIFNLEMTADHLKRALNVTAHTALQGGLILFLCRNAMNTHTVEKTALECGEFAHTRYWRGGTFTNSRVQFKSVTRKLRQLLFNKKYLKIYFNLGLPDLCIFLNTLNNVMLQHTAVRDAAKMNIPTIGIVDSNCSPDLITYVVAGNDDSSASIELYCKLFKEAILRGKAKRKEFLDEIEKLKKDRIEEQ